MPTLWETNWIARIDPKDGHVLGVVNLTGLLRPPTTSPARTRSQRIAYRRKGDRLS